MKSKILLTGLLLLCVSVTARAQWVVSDPSNLAQGIVNSSNEIFEAAKTTQQMYRNSQETQKIYLQGKEYYDKLRGVTNLVRNARRVQQCILLVGEISDIYVNNYDKMLRDEYLTVSELTAIARGYTSLLQEGTNLLRDLQTIINPSQMSMTDKERLDIIDKCYTSLSHLRNRAWLFTRCNIATAVLRARESNDLKRSLALYGTDEEKYW